MIKLRPYQNEDFSQVAALWNKEATKYHYKPLDEVSFANTFIHHRYFDAECTWVGEENGKIIAFASGVTGDDLPLGDVAGYITTVIAQFDDETTAAASNAEQSNTREHDLYQQLLSQLEARFIELGKKQAELLFFNPIKLIWSIPSQPKHEHNNAPGIVKEMPLYEHLLARGYIDRATQCGMYLPLGDFTIPEDILQKEAKAKQLGYQITFYDERIHRGLDTLLEALDNPQWEKDVLSFAAKNAPIVVAVHELECVGFAGPIIRQENGRAFFCGIGVHPQHEGHGLGSTLFFRMVEAFQNTGCDYISLFTGKNNPAIRIYQKAGFSIEKEFSILRKEL